MIVQTDFVNSSGDGTPMFSRSGKSTIYNYKVFSSNKGPNRKLESINEERRKSVVTPIYLPNIILQ